MFLIVIKHDMSWRSLELSVSIYYMYVFECGCITAGAGDNTDCIKLQRDCIGLNTSDYIVTDCIGLCGAGNYRIGPIGKAISANWSRIPLLP
jgi:hypothetical protein